mmetsp:Transcript_38014/g.36403  ORF Transcript_38014/g.36403 Transcript_38014/m.36403 type:complete len:106 (+) Transcript_38014:621-938(+)
MRHGHGLGFFQTLVQKFERLAIWEGRLFRLRNVEALDATSEKPLLSVLDSLMLSFYHFKDLHDFFPPIPELFLLLGDVGFALFYELSMLLNSLGNEDLILILHVL